MHRIATLCQGPLLACVLITAACVPPRAETRTASAEPATPPPAQPFVLPRTFPGPAADAADERTCGAYSPIVGATIFTRYRLPEIPDRGRLRYRALTAAACIRRVDDGFYPLMRQQRWLRGCLQRATVSDLLVEFHIAGDGRVRRIDVVRAEPESPELARCIRLATLLAFDARGCSWHRRFRTDGKLPPMLEV